MNEPAAKTKNFIQTLEIYQFKGKTSEWAKYWTIKIFVMKMSNIFLKVYFLPLKIVCKYLDREAKKSTFK